MRRMIAAATSVLVVGALTVTTGHAGPTFTNVKVGSGFTEPGVHIGPTGTIFVDGPNGLGSHSALHRSTDGGASFDRVTFSRPWDRLPGGGDSDVAIRGSRIYYLDLWAGSNSVSVSEDNGSTWTYGTPITSLPLSDRQWIALGRPDPVTGLDTVYVLYALIQAPNQVMIARSRTGGLTWESHIPVPAVGGARGYTGQLQTDGDKFLAFSWEDNDVLSVATSRDEGETWTTTPIATRVTSTMPSIALDGDDIHVAWVDDHTWTVKIRSSHDRGLTFGPTTELTASDPSDSNIFTWVAARNGKVAVAWYGADTPSPSDPNDVPNSTEWTVRYAESTDAGDTYSAPVVVDPIPTKKAQICTRGLGCDLGGGPSNRELGDFLTVEVGPDGRSFIAYGGRVTRGVRLAAQAS